MSRIKFNLVKLENTLVFQVNEFDTKFHDAKYKASNGIIISSEGYPHIDDKIVRVGFGERYNGHAQIHGFTNRIDRDVRFNKVIEALKDWSINWPGFSNYHEHGINKNFEFSF